MDIKELLTIIQQLTDLSTPSIKEHRLFGKNVYVRAVTYHYTGRLVAIENNELILEDAAWIALSGRWAEALRTGTLDEVEPYPGTCHVSRDAVVDMSEWTHDLPRETK